MALYKLNFVCFFVQTNIRTDHKPDMKYAELRDKYELEVFGLHLVLQGSACNVSTFKTGTRQAAEIVLLLKLKL